MRRPRLLVLVAAAVLAGCGGGKSHEGDRPVAGAARVAIMVLENRELDETVGSPAMPYLTSLARRYALATNYHAIRHPSLPNYIALVTGTTANISDDCPASACPVNERSLVDQLDARGLSWRAYMEDLPHPCFRTRGDEVGLYAQRHNPFMYLVRVARDPMRCHKVVPADRLARDERSGLPRFSWITPNLCHDGHDCGLRSVDRWLRRTVPGLLRALGRDGVLFVVFDEGSTDAACCGGAAGGRVAMVAAGARARRHVRWAKPVTHYGTLATIEDLLGLPRLREARGAEPLGGLLTQARP